MPTIDLPKDVILASLQYCEGNDKWVDRAKDENSNKLHVLIKPILEQWDNASQRCGHTQPKKQSHVHQSQKRSWHHVIESDPRPRII